MRVDYPKYMSYNVEIDDNFAIDGGKGPLRLLADKSLQQDIKFKLYPWDSNYKYNILIY